MRPKKVDGRGNAHLQQRVDASWYVRRQHDERPQPITTGLGALPPPLKLTGVHADPSGQIVPGEAGTRLEGFEPFREVIRYEAAVDDEMGRKKTAFHETTARMNRSSK